MTTTTATREPQHMLALQRANEIRLERAQVKRRVSMAGDTRESRREAGRVFLHPPQVVDRMTAFELLCATRRTGRAVALRFLRAASVSESRRIGDLTPRQRHSLARLLGAEPEPARQPRSLASAAQVTAALTDAGLVEAAVSTWWRRQRRELHGFSPREAILTHQQAVLELAERDADAIRGDLRKREGSG